jgi:hypothetical protein
MPNREAERNEEADAGSNSNRDWGESPTRQLPAEANAGTQLAAPNEIGAKAAQAKALMEVSHAALRTA